MAFSADPVFFASVKRNSGAKRRLIRITCSEDRDLEVGVKDLQKPEWIDIEGVFPGEKLRFERGKALSCIANVNTTHKFFPKKSVQDEAVRVILADDQVLQITVAIPEIVDVIEPFRGVFALDFGTTNSVFAFRGGTAKASKSLEQAKCSKEIPSVVYFKDVSDPVKPRFSIGMEGLFDIRENSSRAYAYVISCKRLLGQDRTMLMIDEHGGSKPGHQQQWHVEDIAAFIIRELLDRAEEELGQRIEHVVATFPPMFSRDRKEAIRRAILKALAAGGVKDPGDANIAMDLDEANAAAFHYIYTNLLDEFRKFDVTEKTVDLLAYDFGGGTIDISLVGVKIARTPQAKLVIETELKGLTGEALYGGDNVTLELFKIAKWRAAVAAAVRRSEEIEARKKAAEKPKNAVDDIWGGGGAAKKKGLFDLDDAPAAKKEEKPAPPAALDPDLAEIVNRENVTVYESCLGLLSRERDTVEEAIRTGKALGEVIAAKERVREVAEKRTKDLEAALETVLPTRYSRYTDTDPHKEDLSRKLFNELWHEVDALKIRLAMAEGGEARKMGGVLRKIARYAGVDPIIFNEISFSIAELDARIEPRITETVRKAYELYRNAQSGSKGGIQMASKKPAEPGSGLRVLLFGNSSNLPIVRRKFEEIFRIPKDNLVMTTGRLKTAVAAGACDEYQLRKVLSGLIQYKPVGFLDRLPCAVGLYHRDLALVGWQNGFWPIFPRGTPVGGVKDLDEKSNFLITPGLQELSIYADHMDGSQSQMVGFIDFTKPLDRPVDPKIFERGAGAAEAEFPLRFVVLPTREILAVNLKTGQSFGMVLEKPAWITEENPFSGMH
jgi:molecular chaperone DnaK (HSP70)